ncbi:uncharacterized protein LOC110449271 [Mizuhopecten yessoensis]|uniref:Uncharacterized protein n=1 Tax=Mizuhopecten yessoensis TaxID=6573 RepID=A0A210QRK4_MIZYE|nr:uncharacterized protein LOC110449271 [Mizuhopecten yessoensis]OWF51370.1 hypothetical protein KP79_PYT14647 [Mizuhopecten yessoensis]
MCGTSSLWARLALLCIVLSMILFIAGFATTSWMVYAFTSGAKIRVGLWKAQACTSAGTCADRTVPDSYRTDGYRGTQAMEVIALLILLVAPIAVLVYVVVENLRTWTFAFVCMILCFLAGLFVTIGMILWLVYVTSPFYVGFSMGLTVMGGILAIIAGLLFIPELEDDSNYRSDTPPPERRSVTPPSRMPSRNLRSEPLRPIAVSPYPIAYTTTPRAMLTPYY